MLNFVPFPPRPFSQPIPQNWTDCLTGSCGTLARNPGNFMGLGLFLTGSVKLIRGPGTVASSRSRARIRPQC